MRAEAGQRGERRPLRAAARYRSPAGTWGFTLVELLVAITILAIVAVLGWRGLDSIIRARTAITENIEQTRGMELTFAQLESDCAHIAPTSLVAGRPTLLATPGALVLVRTVFADDEPTRVQAVAYHFANGQVTRWESPPTRAITVLEASWRAAGAGGDPNRAVVMQSGVTAMSLRTWTSDGVGWRSPSVGADAQAAPAAASAGAPAAPTVTGLEVALELRDHPGKLVKVFLLGTA